MANKIKLSNSSFLDLIKGSVLFIPSDKAAYDLRVNLGLNDCTVLVRSSKGETWWHGRTSLSKGTIERCISKLIDHIEAP